MPEPRPVAAAPERRKREVTHAAGSYLRSMLGMKPSRMVTGLSLGVVLVVLASLVAATLAHEWDVLKASRIRAAYPPLLYGIMPAPGTSPVPGSLGAAGGDFSQVYTSALALRHGESAYFPTTPAFADRWGRPSGYPPLMNWAYVPLTYLPYYSALLLHNAMSLLALFVATALLLKRMGLAAHIPGVVLAQGSLYFLTPIGFMHLERGQFDLFVAVAAALTVACVSARRGPLALAAAAGFLGTLKWTSAAFLGCFCVVGAVFSRRARRWSFVLVPVLMAIGTAIFWRSVREYWTSIEVFEINARPLGLTFTHFLRRTFAKVLPVVVTLVVAIPGLWVARSERHQSQLLFAVSAPLSILLMILATCYGTISYEYHTVALLGMWPGLVVWVEREPFLGKPVKLLTCVLFGALLCVAFRTFHFSTAYDSRAMTKVYAAFSPLFLGLCLYTIWGPLRSERSETRDAEKATEPPAVWAGA
jgi:hypothetical protein